MSVVREHRGLPKSAVTLYRMPVRPLDALLQDADHCAHVQVLYLLPALHNGEVAITVPVPPFMYHPQQ